MDEEFWQETGKRLELVCLVANLSLQPPQRSAEFERTWCAIPETAIMHALQSDWKYGPHRFLQRFSGWLREWLQSSKSLTCLIE